MFTTFKTPRELFSIIVSGLAEILLFGVLFGLLEKLLELPGDHGHLFFNKVQTILFQGLQSKASVAFGLLLQLRASSKLIGLKIANKLVQGDFIRILGLSDGRDFGLP